jgi:hypothetical protein
MTTMRLGLLLILTGFLAAACDAPNRPPRPSVAGAASTSLKNEMEAAAAWTPLGLQVREVLGVNQTRIRSVEEFNSLIAEHTHGVLGLLVRRADADLYISLDIPDERFRAPSPLRDKLLRT